MFTIFVLLTNTSCCLLTGLWYSKTATKFTLPKEHQVRVVKNEKRGLREGAACLGSCCSQLSLGYNHHIGGREISGHHNPENLKSGR